MKKLFVIALAVFSVNSVLAQAPEITFEHGDKIIKGFMSKKELESDSSLKWYAQNLKGFTPEANAIKAFKENKETINIIAFGGTWCSDTQNLLPKFFALTDAAGFSQDRVTLLGVDRSKKTIQHLAEAFNVINVPTFIVMKDGKEIGRVVEYGKYGMVDKELGEIIIGASTK